MTFVPVLLSVLMAGAAPFVGGSSSPEDVTREFFERISAGDLSSASELLAPPSDSRLGGPQRSIEDHMREGAEAFTAKGGLRSIETETLSESDGQAQVHVIITFGTDEQVANEITLSRIDDRWQIVDVKPVGMPIQFVQAALRTLHTYQHMHHARTGRYTSSSDDLADLGLEEDLQRFELDRFSIDSAGADAYCATVTKVGVTLHITERGEMEDGPC